MAVASIWLALGAHPRALGAAWLVHGLPLPERNIIERQQFSTSYMREAVTRTVQLALAGRPPRRPGRRSPREDRCCTTTIPGRAQVRKADGMLEKSARATACCCASWRGPSVAESGGPSLAQAPATRGRQRRSLRRWRASWRAPAAWSCRPPRTAPRGRLARCTARAQKRASSPRGCSCSVLTHCVRALGLGSRSVCCVTAEYTASMSGTSLHPRRLISFVRQLIEHLVTIVVSPGESVCSHGPPPVSWQKR